MRFFAFAIGLSALVFTSQTQAASPTAASLGKLQKPIESIGAITALAQQLQKNIPSDMKTLIDENDCQKTMVLPETDAPLKAGDMKVSKFSVEVSGSGCPVLYKVGLTGTQMADGFEAKFELSYKAQSAEALKIYDINESSMTGVIVAKMINTKDGQGIEFQFKYDGSGNSLTEGAFSSTSILDGKLLVSMGPAAPPSPGAPTAPPGPFPGISLKIDGAFGESFKFAFKNESAEMKSKVVMQGFSPVGEFEINGVKVTEAEYKKLRDQIKLPGMDQKGMGGPTGSTDPQLACTVEVFKSTDFSVKQATDFIQLGGAKPNPMKTSKACGNMHVDLAEVDHIPYRAEFMIQPTHATVSVNLCEPGKPCVKSSRSFLPDEKAAYADDLLGRYTILTSCDVVQQCEP